VDGPDGGLRAYRTRQGKLGVRPKRKILTGNRLICACRDV
jgi:hypothetical protein